MACSTASPARRHDATWSYGYNPASQIASVTRDNDSYAWTSHYAANRDYTTDGLNQLYGRRRRAAFAYDAQRQPDRRTAPRTYSYDVENRLVGRSGNVTLRYDPLGPAVRGRRRRRDHPVPLRRRCSGRRICVAGAMTAALRPWRGADVPLVCLRGRDASTQPSYLHADHQGSIVAISDPWGNGTINRYDEYGIPAATNLGPVPIYRPDLAPRARHVSLQGAGLLAHAGPVPADRSGRV